VEPGTFPHNAMYYSDATHGGASLIQATGEKLDFQMDMCRWSYQRSIHPDQKEIN